MDITLSQYAGFCDGVKRAFDLVMDVDILRSHRPIFVLGSLVHNEDVIKKIEERGIARITREEFLAKNHGEVGTIIINAHGAGPDIFEHAIKIGAEIIDTTCPKVIRVQKLAQVYAKRGSKIIIVGDHGHKEVKGIDEWGDRNATTISREEDLKNLSFESREKIAVLSQTTQNEDFLKKISDIIKAKYENAEINLTTCQTTHNRQEEVKKLAKVNEAVIIVGSKASANSRRLWEIARAINPRSYFIEKMADMKPDWFLGIKKAGVTAGASTPDWIISEVIENLERS